MLFLLTTGSELIVAPLAEEAFTPTRTWRVADTPTWAHPVILDDGVLIKDLETLALLRFEREAGADAPRRRSPTGAVTSSTGRSP